MSANPVNVAPHAAGKAHDQASDLLDLALARRLCDASPLGIFLADARGMCIYSNAACQQITGLTLSEALGRPWDELVHPDDRDETAMQWLAAVREERAFQAEVRIRRSDGSIRWARLNAATVRGGSKISAYLLMMEDVTERKASERVLRDAEEALFEEKERAQVTLASIGDAVLVTDAAGDVTYLNPEAERLTGWSDEDAVGRPLTEVFRIVDGITLKTARNPAQQAIDEGRTVGLALGCLLVSRDGTTVPIEDSAAPIHNRAGGVTGAVIVFHDAAQSKAITERNAHLARHDSLTGLANTALLTERLSQGIALARRHRSRLALLFIDMDRFKGVNDVHGHLVGDELLKSVARRLKGCVRATDTVARRGGDEFVILLAEIDSRRHAAHVANKVLSALSETYVIEGVPVASSASVGISVYPEDGEDATTLLQYADSAMYESKAASADDESDSAGPVRKSPLMGGWTELHTLMHRVRPQRKGKPNPLSRVSSR